MPRLPFSLWPPNIFSLRWGENSGFSTSNLNFSRANNGVILDMNQFYERLVHRIRCLHRIHKPAPTYQIGLVEHGTCSSNYHFPDIQHWSKRILLYYCKVNHDVWKFVLYTFYLLATYAHLAATKLLYSMLSTWECWHAPVQWKWLREVICSLSHIGSKSMQCSITVLEYAWKKNGHDHAFLPWQSLYLIEISLKYMMIALLLQSAI